MAVADPEAGPTSADEEENVGQLIGATSGAENDEDYDAELAEMAAHSDAIEQTGLTNDANMAKSGAHAQQPTSQPARPQLTVLTTEEQEQRRRVDIFETLQQAANEGHLTPSQFIHFECYVCHTTIELQLIDECCILLWIPCSRSESVKRIYGE